MLLDRRRVKFWQKWVFGFMAIIMAAFLLMIPLSNRLGGCGGTPSALKQLNTDVTNDLAAVKASPSSAAAWSTLADTYQLRSNPQTGATAAAQKADKTSATAAYERASKLLAKQPGPTAKQERLDVLNKLVALYVSLSDNQQALTVYGEITTLTPKDAQAYFDMATAAINAGNTNMALLALGKFLELDPKSPDAPAVKKWIKANAPSPAPTTKGSTK